MTEALQICGVALQRFLDVRPTLEAAQNLIVPEGCGYSLYLCDDERREHGRPDYAAKTAYCADGANRTRLMRRHEDVERDEFHLSLHRNDRSSELIPNPPPCMMQLLHRPRDSQSQGSVCMVAARARTGLAQYSEWSLSW